MVEQASHQISAGETAVVVGAGLAGLLAAAALSDFFKNVVVVERDRLPTRPGLRKGVPQGAHTSIRFSAMLSRRSTNWFPE
jgi:2-polyprenyl-6-methoxyphenol hydroxylase-like FAD-dependent oxidoreductase